MQAVATAGVIEAARLSLGAVGAYLPASLTTPMSVSEQSDAAQRLERAGYRAAWANELIGGKDVFAQVAVLMAATERITFGTGIADIRARAPQIAHYASAWLAQAYPERFVLGLGVGNPQRAEVPGREFGPPLATMREYLERMNSPVRPPAADTPYPRLIGANGPEMVALAAELADGVIPAMMPPAFTRRARLQLAPDKLIVMSLSVVAEADTDRARAVARDRLVAFLARSPARAAILPELGFTAEEVGNLSDRLVDALIGNGSPDTIAALVREHLEAGANHVALIPSGTSVEDDLDQLERIAPALADLAEAGSDEASALAVNADQVRLRIEDDS
jgi:probable F420-dependent oxidoreductase